MLSLYCLPMLFGSISPAKNTTIVVMSVLTETAPTPQRLVTATVTMEAAAIWTMFVPISMVVMALSKFSSTHRALSALLLPRSAASLILVFEAEA